MFLYLSPGPKKFALALSILAMASYLAYYIVLISTIPLGLTFHSAMLSPYRRYARLVGSIWSVLYGIPTYMVRRNGWSVLLKMAMGIEGYPYRVPTIGQHPSYLPNLLIRYEKMSEGAGRRALEKRRAWISRHFDNVTQTFSQLVVTAADITSLLREVEVDQSLVHAAYYTDDECIARIADWLAGRG